MNKKYKIGLQSFSVKPQILEDLPGTLRRVADMGYECMEFSGGYYDRGGKGIKEVCAVYGMTVPSMHRKYQLFLEDAENELKDITELGAEYCVIPWVPEKSLTTDFDQTVKDIKRVKDMLAERGITMLFHNHFGDVLLKHGSETVFDAILRETGIGAQLDLAHLHYAGINPVEYIKKYGDDIKVVHIRDFECTGLPQGKLYQMPADKRTYLPNSVIVDEAAEGYVSRPVGYGRNDFAEIMHALDNTAAEYLIVELAGPDEIRLGDAKKSIDFIKEMGY